MKIQTIFKNNFVKFLLTFFIVFLGLYFGTTFFVGLSIPGGYYSPFVEKYLNIAALMRNSLLGASKILLTFFGVTTVRIDDYILRAANGRGIRMVYACLGFGVLSFWASYIIATVAKISKKIYWLVGGLLFIWVLNVLRISLVLVAANNNWQYLFGWDHHTWFNIIAYSCIFLMMYLFEKNIKPIK